jgi:hypothetical protein
MAWYSYLILFFGGFVLANGVPHFVRGISGEKFQSPFATPRGVGESSPVVNLVWGFANLAVGLALVVRLSDLQSPDAIAQAIAIGAGILACGLFLSLHFGRVRGNMG